MLTRERAMSDGAEHQVTGSPLGSRMLATATVPSYRRLQLVGWRGLFLVMIGARTDHRPYLPMVGWRLVYIVIGATLSLALRMVLRRALVRPRSTTTVAAMSVITSYLLALVWTATYNMMRQPFAHLWNGAHTVVDALNRIFLGAINDSFILMAWGFLYVGLKHSIALQRERERALRAETFAAESRLGALQYQLNPHLFFNTLNAISTLIVEQRADEATLMIARLSDFLRTTLRQEAAVLVSFAEELAFVAQYLDIEQIRFSDRLQVTYDIEADACRAQVPVLLLQPLVENAIHHGIATLQGAGSIALTGRVRTERLFVTVENSGSSGAETARTDGIGLANVRGRLAALYGDRQELRCTAGPDGGFRVDIELPFVVASNQRRAPMRRDQTPTQA
jgi:two-component system LytT family sensor kinase